VTETSEDIYRGTIFEQMGTATGRHPQKAYAAMRSTGAVQRVGNAVIVTSRAAVDEVFRHPGMYSSKMESGRHGNIRPLIPLEIDPPVHKKFRKIMDPLFAPQRMQQLAEPIERLVNDLIDSFIDEGEIDFAQQFSIPFPSQVFLTLFGLPLDETARFIAMKDGINRPYHVIGRPMNDPETVAYRDKVAQELYGYFEQILDERARQPRDDLLTHFLTAEVDGHHLSREDILDICFLFFIAGLDTVSASLECFFAYLAEHPDTRTQLVADPSTTQRAVEELLRWESPVMLVSRVATNDTELAGCPVHAGDEVYAFIGSANTDESESPDAGQVRLDRATNPHIAFGGGIHRCLGSHLARLELRVALREWHARIPQYRIKAGHEFTYTVGVRAIDSFPMILGETR
jgi:cytochrome P450